MIRQAIGAAVALALLATPAGAQTVSGYQPQDEDERGLWMVMDEYERQLQRSNFVMRDPGLNAYVNEVFCRIAGDQCEDIRIYIVRTPYFNASMAPNGVMEIWSGLFLRVRNEAQLAAVLGHEFTHYRNRHSLQMFRTVRDRTNVMSFLGIELFVAGGGLLATAGQLAMISSLFSYTREMEREADTESVRLLVDAGYDPMAASRIWAQIRDERDARAEDRGHDGRGEDAIFGTHPLSEDRMVDLRMLAEAAGEGGERYRDRYTLMLAPHWQAIVDDQINLNDYGATRHLLDALAADGWTAELRYAEAELMRRRGETGDFNAATRSYEAALLMRPDMAEAWRGLGYALLRLDRQEEGRTALRQYLALRPDAEDAAMVAMLAGVTS
ncbi:M48 family metallopeptidase [uncultured Parasphingopyxis sp.]|uniref:M48 family metallopeptidase n=1 Tax=uncultured Parasphingopyxis sp. TaxID=1547918 RepID=UPI002626BABD|nr:M48 family metallopeptidase [uncultured Parasphingopyxis sp.]